MDNQPPSLPKILLVDDEPSVLGALQRIFHDDSYDVLTAPGGLAALDLLKETGPVQLVISDYRMPGMTGVEFLQKVMQLWPDTRRVILSGYTESDVLLAALNEGRVHYFLVKPWEYDEIKKVVAEMLEEYEMLVNFRFGAEELARSNRLLSRTNEHLSIILADILENMRLEAAHDCAKAYASLPPISLDGKSYASLSPRERQIMLAIASGHSLKAVAHTLGLSIKTVSTYKKRLLEKMGLLNDAELIRYTLKNNLLPDNLS